MTMARLAALAALAWAGMLPATALAQGADACDIAWLITPHLDATPRHLAVSLRFAAGPRSRTELQWPQPWAGVDDDADHVVDLRSAHPHHAMEPIAGQPMKRLIQHRPGDAVLLSYRVTSPIVDADASLPRSHRDSQRTLLGQRWFQAFGHALLVAPAGDATPQRLCLDFDGLDERGWWVNSHRVQQGRSAQIRFKGFEAEWEETPIGKVLSEKNRPIVLRDHERYELKASYWFGP